MSGVRGADGGPRSPPLLPITSPLVYLPQLSAPAFRSFMVLAVFPLSLCSKLLNLYNVLNISMHFYLSTFFMK